jgi:hypothetical protein
MGIMVDFHISSIVRCDSLYIKFKENLRKIYYILNESLTVPYGNGR